MTSLIVWQPLSFTTLQGRHSCSKVCRNITITTISLTTAMDHPSFSLATNIRIHPQKLSVSILAPHHLQWPWLHNKHLYVVYHFFLPDICLQFLLVSSVQLIGRKGDNLNAEVQSDIKHFPFKVINRTGKPYVRVNHHGEDKEFVCLFLCVYFVAKSHLWSPEEISSTVLLKMKDCCGLSWRHCCQRCCHHYRILQWLATTGY